MINRIASLLAHIVFFIIALAIVKAIYEAEGNIKEIEGDWSNGSWEHTNKIVSQYIAIGLFLEMIERTSRTNIVL